MHRTSISSCHIIGLMRLCLVSLSILSVSSQTTDQPSPTSSDIPSPSPTSLVSPRPNNNSSNNNPGDSRICIPLATSKSCPGLSLFSVLSTSDFRSVADLDSYVNSQSPSNPEYVTRFRSTFDCPRYSPSMERYHTSVLCYFLVSVSLPQCPPSSPPAIKSSHVLCQPICHAYINSIQSIFQNETACNPRPANNVTALRNEVVGNNTSGFADYCQTLPSVSGLSSLLTPSSGVCQGGLASELKNCGFLTAEQGKAYCAANTMDPCCWPGPKSGVPPFPLGPPTDLPWIMASVGAGILILMFPTFFVIDKFLVPSKPPQMAYVQKVEVAENEASVSSQSSAHKHRVSYVAVDRMPSPKNVITPISIPASSSSSSQSKKNGSGSSSSHSAKPRSKLENEVRIGAKDYTRQQNSAHSASSSSSGRSQKDLHYYKTTGPSNINHTQKLTSPSSSNSLRSKRTSSIAAHSPGGGNGKSVLKSPLGSSGYNNSIREEEEVDNITISSYKATVLISFDAQQDDEISLLPGQVIFITEAFDDGWGVGTLQNSSETGVFPLRATDAPLDLCDRLR